ncbi:MAG: MFS transporter [Pirellula sp.]|jgi:MFS family permease|nr:MFS transporter [Pirellula sp.]
MKESDRSLSRLAWLLVVLLMPVALLNYLDRQMLASMQSSVMESIPSLGKAENKEELWGLMLGQFKWVYAGFSLVGGYIADRFSRRFTICGSLFVWSAVTWWTGQVTTYYELLWARTLMGVSEAFYIPAALALITDYHQGETRSRAIGLHQLGIYLGVIAGGFGGYVAANPDYGWRFAFSLCGGIGMLYAVPLVLLLRDAPKFAEAANRDAVLTVGSQSPWSVLKELLSNPSFVLLVLYFTLPAMAGWVVRDWMPSILKKQYNIGQGQAGVAATVYWQVAAIVGVVVGGWLADRWMRSNQRGRIYVSAMGMMLIVVSIFGVGIAGTLVASIGCLIVFGIGWGFFDCNNMPILSQIIRPQFRASGYGIMNFVSISAGGVADWGFGVMRDKNIPLHVIFSGFAMLAIISVLLVLLIRPNAEITRAEQASQE